MQSRYANAVPSIVAEMENERLRDDGNLPPGEQPPPPHHRPEKNIIYVYPVEGGGVYLSETKVEDEDTTVPIVDAEPETDQRPRTARQIPPLLHFLLLLFMFLGLDNVDAVFAQLAPTVSVTITPVVKNISISASVTVGGAGADIQGHMLAPLTLSQAQTVNATGRGHQDAARATGTLTFYNGSYTPHTIQAGTVYTGSDGVAVAVDQTITIPAAAPPQFGEATVPAHAHNAGAAGNIQAFALSRALSNALTVKNLTPFTGGRDARDFTIVRKADIDQPAATLQAQVTQSMQAALQGEVRAEEQLLLLSCRPTITASDRVGDEARQVHITVSETCSALVYDPGQLTTIAIRQLSTKAVAQIGAGYRLSGNVTLSATKASPTTINNAVLVTFTCRGTWVYQFDETRVKALIAGKPRRTALHLLSASPGVQAVSITGVSDNTQLPADPARINLNILYFVS